MKDYIKINRAIDLKQIEQQKIGIEKQQEQGLYPKQFSYPVTLQFEVTGACNLACKHCYNRSGDADRRTNDYTVMTPDKWCDLAHQIVNDGGIFQCIISGGEPLLLGDRLFDIMDILHDDGTSFVVITNGMLLTKEKVQRFSKYRFFWFQISIDGSTPELHDEFRGVKGSWANAVNGALEVSARGIPLVIAHSVTPKTLPYLEDMVMLAHSLGAGSIMLGDILLSGRAYNNSDIIMTNEQKNELYAKIAELSQKYAGKIKIERSADVSISMQKYLSEPNTGGIIRPNGDFRIDCMAPFVIGNVLEQPLKEIWMAKGIDAWTNEKVKEYIASINFENQTVKIQNHVDGDIRL